MHAAAAFGGYPIFLPQLNRGADHKQTNGNIERHGQDQHLLHALHTALLPSNSKKKCFSNALKYTLVVLEVL